MSIVLGKASIGRHFVVPAGAASGIQIITELGVVVDGPPEQTVTVESVEVAVTVESTELAVEIESLN